ncbi:hypothetical protein ABPG75_008413 [Micractinium tetrahymenae]
MGTRTGEVDSMDAVAARLKRQRKRQNSCSAVVQCWQNRGRRIQNETFGKAVAHRQGSGGAAQLKIRYTGHAASYNLPLLYRVRGAHTLSTDSLSSALSLRLPHADGSVLPMLMLMVLPSVVCPRPALTDGAVPGPVAVPHAVVDAEGPGLDEQQGRNQCQHGPPQRQPAAAGQLAVGAGEEGDECRQLQHAGGFRVQWSGGARAGGRLERQLGCTASASNS